MNQLVRAHATDDQGFPLNPNCCAACKQRSQRMNDRAVAQLFGGLFKSGHDEHAEHVERDLDYSEAGGMK